LHHENPLKVKKTEELSKNSTLEECGGLLNSILEDVYALDIEREMLGKLTCPKCGNSTEVFLPLESVSSAIIPCPKCHTERIPFFFHTITKNSSMLSMTLSEVGLPLWDILWARYNDNYIGIEISGDAILP
jgi:ssDNA-binding Zn-finger/Zn-ribbon topoisomerase 1